MKWIIFIHIMHDAHLASLDLNLLVALSALVAEENVTRAGAKIGLSQSAMSHALGRLRATFDDAILVRSRGKMVATARARALALDIDDALSTLSRAIGGGKGFDPARAKRTFTIAMSDYAELVVLPPLLARLRREAPGIDLWVVVVTDPITERLARGDVDLAIAPTRAIDRAPGIFAEPLFDERFVCVFRKGHPLGKARLTVKRFAEASHVLVAPGGQRGSFVDSALESLGLARNVVCGVPHFLVVPHLLAHTDLVVTLAERVVRTFPATAKLEVRTPPLDVPGFVMSQLWHARHERDEGHAWLRGLIADVTRDERQTVRSSRAKRAPR